MPATIPTIIVGNSAVNVTTNFPVSGILSTDVVVVCVSRGSGSPATTITGLGATWNVAFASVAVNRHQAWWATGITAGSGNIGIRVFNPIDAGRVEIYVLRGLTNPGLNHISQGVYDNVQTVFETSPITSFGKDQVGIAVGTFANSDHPIFPLDTTPGTGWTLDDKVKAGDYATIVPHAAAHIIGDPYVTEIGGSIRVVPSGTDNLGITIMVFGDASAPPLPLPGTGFSGWGIEL